VHFSSEKLSGNVWALGSEASIAAQFYAGLTGRTCTQVNSVDEVNGGNNDVVVCSTQYLSSRLMSRICLVSHSQTVPGLICGRDAAGLEAICRRLAARLTRPSSGPLKRTFVGANLQFASAERGSDLFTGGLETVGKLTPRISSGSSILVIAGLSNGFDIGVSMRQYICPFVPALPAGDGFLPTCQKIGRCTRFPSRPLIQEAYDKGRLLPVSSLCSDIAILYGCGVLKLQDGHFDPSYGLGERLLADSEVGAVITTWRNEFGPASVAHLNTLVNDLSAGRTVGTAVASFNRSEFAVQFGVKLCLLGDPSFCLSPEQVPDQLPVGTLNPRSEQPPNSDPDIAEANLLRTAITRSMQLNSLYDTASGENLLTELSVFLETGCQMEGKENWIREMDAKLVRFLSAFPLLNLIFGQFLAVEGMSEDAICPFCGSAARAFCAKFPKYGAQERQVIRCAICNESRFVPVGWEVSLSLTRLDEGILLLSNIPAGAQVLVCLLSYPTVELYKSYEWQPTEQGSWSVFQLPELPESMVFYCQILIAHGLRVGTLGFKLKRKHSI
jgi:hypothetical protein